MPKRTETFRKIVLEYIFSHKSLKVGICQAMAFVENVVGDTHSFKDFHKQRQKLKAKLPKDVYEDYILLIDNSLFRLYTEMLQYEEYGGEIHEDYIEQCYKTFAREHWRKTTNKTLELFQDALNTAPLQNLENILKYFHGVASKSYHTKRLPLAGASIVTGVENLKKHFSIITPKVSEYIEKSLKEVPSGDRVLLFEFKNKFLREFPE